MARYHYYNAATPVNDKDDIMAKVICISSFAGRKVRGVAICSKEDEFDWEKGKAIARARVDAEIARRRVERAEDKYHEALRACDHASEHLEKMIAYASESRTALKEAEDTLANLISAE